MARVKGLTITGSWDETADWIRLARAGFGLEPPASDGQLAVNSGISVGHNAPTSAIDITGSMTLRGISAPSVAPSGQGRLYYDSTSNTVKLSLNGGPFADLGGGGISGSIAATQLAVGNGANSIGGGADLTYTAGNFLMLRNHVGTTQLTVRNTQMAASAGDAAYAAVAVHDGTYTMNLVMWADNHSNAVLTNAAGLTSTRPGGMVFENISVSGGWRWGHQNGGATLQRMSLTSAGNLEVLGTLSASSAKLVYDGTFLWVDNPTTTGGSFNKTLQLKTRAGGAGSGVYIQFTNDASGDLSRIGAVDINNWGGALVFYTKPADGNGAGASREVVRFAETGSVGMGVGAAIPSYAGYTTLAISNATTGATVDLQQGGSTIGEFFAGTTDVGLLAVGSRYLSFRVNTTTEALRITSSGVVTVGDGSVFNQPDRPKTLVLQGSEKGTQTFFSLSHRSPNGDIDQGMLGWNYHVNGSGTLTRQNGSMSAVRWASNPSTQNQYTSFFVTFATTGGTDKGVMTGGFTDNTGAKTYVNVDGNLGVGLALGVPNNPAWPIHVRQSSNAEMRLESNTTTNGENVAAISMFDYGVDDGWIISRRSSGWGAGRDNSLEFSYYDGSYNDALVIRSNGNVGIANTNPQQKLDITGSVRFSSAMIAAGGTFPLQISYLGSEQAAIGVGANPRITFNTNGAGITLGTTLLAEHQATFTKNPDGTTDAAATLRINPAAAAADEKLFAAQVNNVTRVWIDSSGHLYALGNVGIGETVPGTALQITRSVDEDHGIWVTNNSTGTSASAQLQLFHPEAGSFNIHATSSTYSYQAGTWANKIVMAHAAPLAFVTTSGEYQFAVGSDNIDSSRVMNIKSTAVEFKKQTAMKTHSAFAGSDRISMTGAVQTTNATQTTVLAMTLEDTSTYLIEVAIMGRYTAGDRAFWKVMHAFAYREGGGATLSGTSPFSVAVDSYGGGAATATLTASGNDIRVSVTGEAATTINWACTLSYQKVSGNA